jgi:hypothetical protein
MRVASLPQPDDRQSSAVRHDRRVPAPFMWPRRSGIQTPSNRQSSRRRNRGLSTDQIAFLSSSRASMFLDPIAQRAARDPWIFAAWLSFLRSERKSCSISVEDDAARCRSIQDGWEVAPPRRAVVADRHQRHRPDRAKALRQTPTEQRCAFDRHEKRDWLFGQPDGPKEQRSHVILRLGNTVIGQP